MTIVTIEILFLSLSLPFGLRADLLVSLMKFAKLSGFIEVKKDDGYDLWE